MPCPSCTPELAPTGPRRHEQHHGIRFEEDWRLIVLKDGEQILDCYEVDVRAGQAWRFREPLAGCACREGFEAYIDTGQFSVAEQVGT
jgi:hypothetical protein